MLFSKKSIGPRKECNRPLIALIHENVNQGHLDWCAVDYVRLVSCWQALFWSFEVQFPEQAQSSVQVTKGIYPGKCHESEKPEFRIKSLTSDNDLTCFNTHAVLLLFIWINLSMQNDTIFQYYRIRTLVSINRWHSGLIQVLDTAQTQTQSKTASLIEMSTSASERKTCGICQNIFKRLCSCTSSSRHHADCQCVRTKVVHSKRNPPRFNQLDGYPCKPDF